MSSNDELPSSSVQIRHKNTMDLFLDSCNFAISLGNFIVQNPTSNLTALNETTTNLNRLISEVNKVIEKLSKTNKPDINQSDNVTNLKDDNNKKTNVSISNIKTIKISDLINPDNVKNNYSEFKNFSDSSFIVSSNNFANQQFIYCVDCRIAVLQSNWVNHFNNNKHETKCEHRQICQRCDLILFGKSEKYENYLNFHLKYCENFRIKNIEINEINKLFHDVVTFIKFSRDKINFCLFCIKYYGTKLKQDESSSLSSILEMMKFKKINKHLIKHKIFEIFRSDCDKCGLVLFGSQVDVVNYLSYHYIISHEMYSFLNPNKRYVVEEIDLIPPSVTDCEEYVKLKSPTENETKSEDTSKPNKKKKNKKINDAIQVSHAEVNESNENVNNFKWDLIEILFNNAFTKLKGTLIYCFCCGLIIKQNMLLQHFYKIDTTNFKYRECTKCPLNLLGNIHMINCYFNDHKHLNVEINSNSSVKIILISQNYLNLINSVKDKGKIFICLECKKKFNSKKKMSAHYNDVDREVFMNSAKSCHDCEIYFYGSPTDVENYFSYHRTICHNGPIDKNACYVYENDTFPSFDYSWEVDETNFYALNAACEISETISVIYCTICMYSVEKHVFDTHLMEYDHIYNYYKNAIKECPKCNMNMFGDTPLMDHYFNCHNVIVHNEPYEIIDISFCQLLLNKPNKKSDNDNFICLICCEVISDDNWKNHIIQHSTDPYSLMKSCEKCNLIFYGHKVGTTDVKLYYDYHLYLNHNVIFHNRNFIFDNILSKRLVVNQTVDDNFLNLKSIEFMLNIATQNNSLVNKTSSRYSKIQVNNILKVFQNSLRINNDPITSVCFQCNCAMRNDRWQEHVVNKYVKIKMIKFPVDNILYLLGSDHSVLESYKSIIQQKLSTRNEISKNKLIKINYFFHFIILRPISIQLFYCIFCNLCFSHKCSWNKHVQENHKLETKLIVCAICNIMIFGDHSTAQYYYRYHNELIHNYSTDKTVVFHVSFQNEGNTSKENTAEIKNDANPGMQTRSMATIESKQTVVKLLKMKNKINKFPEKSYFLDVITKTIENNKTKYYTNICLICLSKEYHRNEHDAIIGRGEHNTTFDHFQKVIHSEKSFVDKRCEICFIGLLGDSEIIDKLLDSNEHEFYHKTLKNENV